MEQIINLITSLSGVKKAGHENFKKRKYYMITYYTINFGNLVLLVIWNKEEISMKYLDNKRQKTPLRHFTPKISYMGLEILWMEIPLNTHQNSLKIRPVKYHICWWFFCFVLFVCFLGLFSPHIMQ